MNSIPDDLVLDIFSRLPPKSIAMCRCVSKPWASMLHRQVFKPRPRLLFAVEQSESGVWEFFSVLQPQTPSEKSSSRVVTADLHIKFRGGDGNKMLCTNNRQFSCGYVSGLVYFSGVWTKHEEGKVPVVCNPNTGQYVILPYLYRYRKAYSCFGYDQIDKQFKVLYRNYPSCSDGRKHRILTLGTGKMKWRKIKCSLTHTSVSEGICINGVLYYLGDRYESDVADVIVCMDVRSEKFKFFEVECFGEKWLTQLINYKGENICVAYWRYDQDDHEVIELRMWVLDYENQEWSKYDYTLRDGKFAERRYIFSVVGVIATTGEIVLSMTHKAQPLYVFYYNPETEAIQRVEIRGFGVGMEASDYLNVFTFIDHGDDFNNNDAKLLRPLIYRCRCEKAEITASPASGSKKKRKGHKV